jgi:hypothetical protein
MSATWFLQHGSGVFPLIAGTKRPSGPWRNQVHQRDVSRLAHYGVEPMAPLVVLDVDSVQTATWIEQAIGRDEIPETPFRVLTGPRHDGSGGRGVHRYYRRTMSEAPRFILRDGLSIEFKSEGQYIVGPGSTHPSGLTYTAAEWSWQFDDLPIFPADFIFDDGSCGKRTSAVRGEEYEVPERVTRGERRAELFKLVRSQKALGADQEAARYAVNLFAENVCDPPLTAKDFAPETPASWFNRAWNQPDRMLDPVGTRVPLNIDLSTPEWF